MQFDIMIDKQINSWTFEDWKEGILHLSTQISGLDAGFRKVGFVSGNFKQKQIKFLNFHWIPYENEIIFAKKGGFEQPQWNTLDPPRI